MSVESPPSFISATYGAEQLRRTISSLVPRGSTIGSVVGGIIGSGDMAVTAGSGLQVLVAPGEAWVPGSSSATQGGYYSRVASSTALTVSAADASKPRVDLVVAQVQDAAYAGATNSFQVAILTGTATSGATLSNLTGAPSLTASSLALAYVLVPASASSISTISNVQTAIPPPGLFPVVTSSSVTAASGQCIITTGSSALTVTLPAHAKGQTVAVINVTSNTTTVAGSNIQGLGLSSASSFPLGLSHACAVLLDDGSSWDIISGAQDTGWVQFATLGTHINGGAGTSATPASRLIGDRVYLRGLLQSSGTVTTGSVIFTLASTFAPASTVGAVLIAPILAPSTLVPATNASIEINSASGGVLNAASSMTSSQQIALTGLTYSLVD